MLEQRSRKLEVVSSGVEGGLGLIDDAPIFPLFVLPLSAFKKQLLFNFVPGLTFGFEFFR